MTDAKKLKKMRKHLSTFTRAHLVALAQQRTEMRYQEILKSDNETLINALANITGVLKPVDRSGVAVEVAE